MNHYMVGPKTKRIKCLEISQTPLGTKVDKCPKRVCMEFQRKLEFNFKEREYVIKMNDYDLRYMMDHERYG